MKPATAMATGGGLLVAAAAGAAISGGLLLGPLTGLPPGALLISMPILALLPIALVRWRFALSLFLVWLVVEDLLRKLAGNDIRIALMKDVVFLIVVASLLSSKEVRGAWKEATGRERIFLYLLIAWAVILSIPTGLQDWRLPLVGLRLDFFYVPLVIAGYLLIKQARSPEKWLVGLAVLGGLASLVGVIQGVVGPEFLSPAGPVTGLPNLVLIRGSAEAPVYRPTGTFVDPGRFGSLTRVALAFGLAAFLVSRRHRIFVMAATLISAAAVWVSGGRGGFITSGILVIVALSAPYLTGGRGMKGRSTLAAASGVAAVLVIAALFPVISTSRAIWYQTTLDPRSPRNEWTMRFNSYWGSTVHGVAEGGPIGRGTGRHTLGRQYLYEDRSVELATSLVEGGYAVVAVEWGWIGLALWIAWSLTWVRRQWRCIATARGSPLAPAATVLFTWVLFFLFIGFFAGFQGFQNYIANAYFWLISGMIFALPAAARAMKPNEGMNVDSSA